MPTIFSKLAIRAAAPRVILRIPSLGHVGHSSEETTDEATGYGNEGKEKPNVESGISEMKSLFKWAGGFVFALFGANYYFDTTMEAIDDQEGRLKGHMKAELNQLRLEIRNDRLQDQLNGKDRV
ncbi:hypothetical protein FN846DRAFT_903270 [Sphaerosporella brunnea]|uniref:Uncharacterized protein n=1 Tax=Sphaerosporella brunnea TaxID=1250544 RepID=A0A5J5F772_9PEZI|nr:hypothetical protein FN846DRAFT_903270 [Sphaerosporella brunnea]